VIARGNRRIALLASALALFFVGAGASRAEESAARDVYFDAGAVGGTPGGFEAAAGSPSVPNYAPLRAWSPDFSQPVEFTKPGPWRDYSSWKSDGGSGSFARIRVKSD